MTSSSASPPPGVKDGGIWGKNTFAGPNTSAAACVGVLCFCLPGLLILCCPFDVRDAYKVDGKMYTADGLLIGPADNFVASAPPRTQTISRD